MNILRKLNILAGVVDVDGDALVASVVVPLFTKQIFKYHFINYQNFHTYN
jgi:hypothetical protein